jgi:hypothetical protein
MTLELLSKSQLQIINRRSNLRYPLDAAMILDTRQIEMREILDLVHQKEIRQTISQESILRNWEIAKQEKGKGVDLIVYTKEIPEEKILEAIERIGHFEITKSQ